MKIRLLMIGLALLFCFACSSPTDSNPPDGDLDMESGLGDSDSDPDNEAFADGDNELEGDTEAENDIIADGDLDSEPDIENELDIEPEQEAVARLYRSEGGMIWTEHDQALYLRGANFSGSTKGIAGHLMDLTDDEIALLKASGFNSVRFLTYWKAVMPDSADVIDDTYLAAFAAQAQRLTDAGILVIIDMHQDLWGVPFVTHGAPDWACPADIKAGYTEQSPWWLNYTSAQVTGCFDNFYGSEELQAAYARAWAAVASAVCSNTGVLGWDLMNEPYPGSGLGNRRFDNETLLPFYLSVSEAIEAACPGRLHVFEPSAAIFPADPFEIPAAWMDRAVIAPHFYPRYVHEPDGGGYSGDSDALRTLFMGVVQAYLDLPLPVWVGEFGGITTNAGFGDYLQDLYAIMAENHIGSAIWDWYRGDGGFAVLNAAGELKPEMQGVYLSPLPTRLPDVPSKMSVDPDSGALDLEVACHTGRELEIRLFTETSACQTQSSSLQIINDFEMGALYRCSADEIVAVTCTR